MVFIFEKTDRYKFDSLIKTLIILCEYYWIFNRKWDCYDFDEFINNLEEIKNNFQSIILNLIDFKEIEDDDENNYIYSKIERI